MMKSGKTWIIVLAQIIWCSLQSGDAVLNDEIKSLPGQPSVKFRQFSGYVTVDDKHERELFYYFVEAETKPRARPLVLWLNGGPGCSSVGEGAFVENGPFRPTSRNHLRRNEHSWNKEANMLYLESPAGVGFSYSSNTSYYTGIDDDMTARDNLIFLHRWFDKFPEYKGRDLFITGESYAGHYVPQLAQLIIRSGAKFNLKGIAIGNPLLEFNTDFNSVPDFLRSHGQISDSSYSLITEKCNYSEFRREAQILNSISPTCQAVIKHVGEEMGEIVDFYDVLLDVCINTSSPFLSSSLIHPFRRTHRSLLAIPPHRHHGKVNHDDVDVCAEEKAQQYLNRKDVQKAMNARLVGVSNWTTCSSVVNYNMSNLEKPTIGIVGQLVEFGLRVLVYSGDEDSVVPFLGTRKLVELLAKELKLQMKTPYRNWLYGNKIGGWARAYGLHNNLTFATVRGASHMVPFTNPESSLYLFTSFLNGKPLEIKIKS